MRTSAQIGSDGALILAGPYVDGHAARIFLFEPSGWLRSATGSVRPGSVLPYSGWIDAGRSCPVLFYCVYSSLFQSIPVYSGLFRSILFYSILFYSRSSPVQPGPAQPGPAQPGPAPSRPSCPAHSRPAGPVQSQFSLAQPGPAQLGPVRPVLVCGSGVVVPVGRALCGLTDGEGPRDLTGRVLCGLTFCRENGLSGRGPVGQLCGRVGALAVAVLAGILSLKVRKRRGTLRVPPFDCIGIFFRSVQKALIDKHLSDPCPVYDRPAASVDEAQRNAEAAVVDVEIGIDLR